MFIFVFVLLVGGATAISLDYYSYTYKFYDEFYTKKEIDNNINNFISQIENQLNVSNSNITQTKDQFNNFKNCIWLNGLSKCLK